MKATDVMRRVYDAFATGDNETLGLLIGDADWVEAAGGPYGGRYRGLTEVAANVFGPLSQDVMDFSATSSTSSSCASHRVSAGSMRSGIGSVTITRRTRGKVQTFSSRPSSPSQF